ncbi:MAG: glutamine--fructose-6-phosphate transaminase (isomerizing) [Chloroflexi bacterium]|nr:glutamine--fructose-6-phosphate transaminase (isomerizing) [Chloroflexota bacterium]
MCGIMGYTGGRQAARLLLEGLGRLEYRGYDSAGIAVLSTDGFRVMKTVGKVDALRDALEGGLPSGTLGIGHTRWATHGKPSLANAHPHLDCHGRVAVDQNGIVENYLSLKADLLRRGHTFVSQTDTEVLPHLIEEALGGDLPLEEAMRQVLKQAQGALALLVADARSPDTLIAVRSGNAGGIVVGHGEGETFVASDLPALLPFTRKVSFLGNAEIAVLRSGRALFTDLQGKAIAKESVAAALDLLSAAKGGYKHFMLKEIMEQPDTLTDAFRGRVDLEDGGLDLPELAPVLRHLARIQRVVLTACGTSHHATLIGRQYIESIAGLPATAEIASELRYRDTHLGPETLVVSISQSGETADTLAAMEEAARQGAAQITISNVPGSAATRLAEATLFIQAGLEVGVAATKTFTGSLLCLYLLAIHLGLERRALPAKRAAELLQDLALVPSLVGRLLEQAPVYEDLAGRLARYQNFLFLGRGLGYPVALEGALKLKEISYIHAEGSAAGEMKHGPIALVDNQVPVVAVAPRGLLREKMAGNIEEVRARDGIVIGLLTQGDDELAARVHHSLLLPEASPLLLPVLAVVPLQLLAYYIGLRRGCDVDQPRNLAKSVTVE